MAIKSQNPQKQGLIKCVKILSWRFSPQVSVHVFSLLCRNKIEKKNSMVSWLTDIESYTFTEYEEQEGCSEPQPQEELDYNDDECSQSPSQTKRKADSVNHRFASVAKRFKTQEHCDFETKY